MPQLMLPVGASACILLPTNITGLSQDVHTAKTLTSSDSHFASVLLPSITLECCMGSPHEDQSLSVTSYWRLPTHPDGRTKSCLIIESSMLCLKPSLDQTFHIHMQHVTTKQSTCCESTVYTLLLGLEPTAILESGVKCSQCSCAVRPFAPPRLLKNFERLLSTSCSSLLEPVCPMQQADVSSRTSCSARCLIPNHADIGWFHTHTNISLRRGHMEMPP